LINKASLVAKGFQQVHGIDYDEAFTPVEKMDVKNAFIHGYLSKEIYMEQPQGFMHDSYLVYQLKKSLYGLKKASRASNAGASPMSSEPAHQAEDSWTTPTPILKTP
jgi:hypothetical protein